MASMPSILRAAMAVCSRTVGASSLASPAIFVRTASSALPALAAARIAQARKPGSLSSSIFCSKSVSSGPQLIRAQRACIRVSRDSPTASTSFSSFAFTSGVARSASSRCAVSW